MKTIHILIPTLAVLMLAGCKQKPAEPQMPTVVFEGFKDTVELELAPAKKAPVDQSYFDQQADRTAQAGTTKPAAKPAATGKAETIYVETEGAQGRVWGHVTMKGDRGTGTIHDWDENTLAVSVTRHGDELFAVDQNSRQYVFKLKK